MQPACAVKGVDLTFVHILALPLFTFVLYLLAERVSSEENTSSDISEVYTRMTR